MRILTLIVLLVLKGHCSIFVQEAVTRPNLITTIAGFFDYDAVDTQAIPDGPKHFAIRTLLSTLETLKTDFRVEDSFLSFLRKEDSALRPNALLKIVLEAYIRLLPYRDRLPEILTKLDVSAPTSPVALSGRLSASSNAAEAQVENNAVEHLGHVENSVAELLAQFDDSTLQAQRVVTPKPFLRRGGGQLAVANSVNRRGITRAEFGNRGAIAVADEQALDLPYFRGNAIARLTLNLLSEILSRGLDAEGSALTVEGFQPNAAGVITLESFAGRVSFPDTKSDARDALFYTLKQKMDRLKMHLRTNLIGQDPAIDGFVNGLFDHYKSLLLQDFLSVIGDVKTYKFREFLQEKRRPSCVLILGPSGTGKTEMFNLAMKFLGNPYGTGSGTDLTKAGYIGGKPDDTVKRLIASTGDDLALAEKRGALFFDEVDKLAVASDGSQREFALGAQHSLLTLIEGSQPLQVEISGIFSKSKIPFKTDRLLIVMAGAFSELISDKAQEERVAPLRDSDLVNYGLCRELVNRIHTIVRTMPLEAKHFIKIMSFQHSPLFQVLQDFSDQGIQIGIVPEALEAFAAFSQKQGFGARNIGRQLRSIVEFSRNQAQVLNRDRTQSLREKKERLEKLVLKEATEPSDARKAIIARVTSEILVAEQVELVQPTDSSFTVKLQHIEDFIDLLTKKQDTGHLGMFM